MDDPDRIFHLALSEDWEKARGLYSVSTVGKSLAEVGFIHCSFAPQVRRTFDLFYAGRTDVVLLEIDRSQLPDVRVEGGFPHVYGPLPTSAVVSATPYRGTASG